MEFEKLYLFANVESIVVSIFVTLAKADRGTQAWLPKVATGAQVPRHSYPRRPWAMLELMA